MASIQCPYDKVYNSTTQTCLSVCVNNTEPMVTDPRSCVTVINCPTGTTQDPVLENTCNKVGLAPPCSQGYSLWTPSTCYVDCPPPYQETGITCLKKTIARIEEPPTCSNIFFYFANGSCNFNYTVIFVSVLFFILFIILISVIKGKNCE